MERLNTMTPRRAWALVAIAALGLALTPWAGLASALVAVAALGALTGLTALSTRDTLKEARIATCEAKLAVKAEDDSRVALMWREYQASR